MLSEQHEGVSGPLLLERYRRPLSFGGVMDETFQIYRRTWLANMGIMALSLIPPVIVGALFGGATMATLFTNPAYFADLDPEEQAALGIGFVGVVLGIVLVFSICVVAADAAVTRLADGAMRGAKPSVWQAWGTSIGRVGAILGASLLFLLAGMGLTLLAIPSLILSLCGLVPLVALVVWAASPSSRKPWLKWTIILSTPFGLPTYFATRWSLYVQAAVLERAGPIGALTRSSALVKGHWFRVFGVLWVVLLLISILENIPSALVGLIGVIVSLMAGVDEDSSLAIGFAVATNAATLVGYLAFGAIAYLAATVMFTDLRNRQEGADLGERLDVLERDAATGY